MRDRYALVNCIGVIDPDASRTDSSAIVSAVRSSCCEASKDRRMNGATDRATSASRRFIPAIVKGNEDVTSFGSWPSPFFSVRGTAGGLRLVHNPADCDYVYAVE